MPETDKGKDTEQKEQAPPQKRALDPSTTPLPAKERSKWTAVEDQKIIGLRGAGVKWEDISKELPGRSATSCRLRYQNYLERRCEWDENRKNQLATLYERFKKDMWEMLEKEMKIPWRAIEAMHWRLGEEGIASRTGGKVFSTSSNVSLEKPAPTPSLPSQNNEIGGYSGSSRPATSLPPAASDSTTAGNGTCPISK